MKSLIAINIYTIVCGSFLIPLWGDFVTKIHGDVRTAGVAICIFSIIIGVLTIITADIERRLKQDRLFMIISAVIFCIGYFGYFFVHSPWQLYTVQAVLGIAGAIQCPAIYALYHRYMPISKSMLHWGIWNGIYNMSVGVAALSSAFIAHHYGFTAVFSVLFTISVIGLSLSVLVMHRVKRFERDV